MRGRRGGAHRLDDDDKGHLTTTSALAPRTIAMMREPSATSVMAASTHLGDVVKERPAVSGGARVCARQRIVSSTCSSMYRLEDAFWLPRTKTTAAVSSMMQSRDRCAEHVAVGEQPEQRERLGALGAQRALGAVAADLDAQLVVGQPAKGNAGSTWHHEGSMIARSSRWKSLMCLNSG